MKKNAIAIVLIVILLLSSFNITFAFGINIKETISNGNILYVGGDGPGNYSTIQEAINDASEGDIIFVFNGTYKENVIIYKSIDLIGENRETTIIDGCENDVSLTISSNYCKIKGFTIQNGYFYSVLISSSNNVLTDNIVTQAIDSGIRLEKSSSNNIISYNIISKNGWCGIDLASNGNTIISNNLIEFNGIDGIYLLNSGNYILNNTLINNGIYFYYFVNTDVSQFPYSNTVENNTINGKRLVYLEEASNKVIDNNIGQIILISCENITVKNFNISKISRGVHLFKSNNCQIEEGSVTSTRKTGIWLYDSNKNTILNNNISGNSHIGILVEKTHNTIISGNLISENYDGIYITGICPIPFVTYYSRKNIISGNVISSSKRFNIKLILSPQTNIYLNSIINCGDLGFAALSIDDSSHFTKIKQNNFINNIIHAEFSYSYLCSWHGNYWGEPRSKPYLIQGELALLFISFPWINIDWHPAHEPYEIDV